MKISKQVMQETMFTGMKKMMTKRLYKLYFKENKGREATNYDYATCVERANRHLDACKFKTEGWPCPTCPECCFHGKDYEDMMTAMNFAEQWAKENPKQAWKVQPPKRKK